MTQQNHHDHVHDHSHTQDKFLDQLKQQGFKLTGKRRTIVEILLAEDRYISARELWEQVKLQFPRVSFDTVYRNLSMLKEEGILEESTFGEGGGKFRILCGAHDHHHHYICTVCGKTEVVEECPMDALNLLGPKGFQVDSHRFEIFGKCAKCANEG